MVYYIKISVILLLSLIFYSSCKKPKPVEPSNDQPQFVDTINRTESILFTIKNLGDGLPLVMQSSLDSGKEYYTSFNEPFRIKTYMYYVSNIFLINENGAKIPIYPTYHLIDASKGDYQQVIQVPNDKFVSIEFLMGVDSARNVSGIQDGALDPLLGMFWEWRTGYIMAKIDGESNVSNYGFISYHTGGFSGEYSVLRTVKLDLEQPFQPNGQERNLILYAEMLQWFNGPNKISIQDKSVISTVGAEAAMLADNYQHMFIKNETK